VLNEKVQLIEITVICLGFDLGFCGEFIGYVGGSGGKSRGWTFVAVVAVFWPFI